jgi:hypothetical protein
MTPPSLVATDLWAGTPLDALGGFVIPETSAQ